MLINFTPEFPKPIRIPRRRRKWEDNINTNLKYMEWQSVELVELVQKKYQWRVLVRMVLPHLSVCMSSLFSVVYSVFFIVLCHCTALCYYFSSVFRTVHCSCTSIVLCLLVMYVLLP
jgi:hypothetical protein